ncbi:radical SAM protein [Candidatus Woesearchaeota archaeon]|nr:radical SAM protein [Candidatus Woesearchaeota archaeon]
MGEILQQINKKNLAKLKFHDLAFAIEGNELKVNLLRSFYFKIPLAALESIGRFYLINESELSFENISQQKASLLFNQLLANYIPNLKNRLFDKQAVYVHKKSGIPLIGTAFIGMTDRNTTCIEIKPITGCNINCIFCSVDEGIDSRKQIDFIVEKDYLIEEFKKLTDKKNSEFIDIYINSHGEPTTYAQLPELIAGLKAIKKVRSISLITNGTLLSKSKIDELTAAGLTRINLSLNAVSQEAANKAAGTAYNVEYVKKLAHYIVQKCELVIAPVYLPGVNEHEIEEIIKFAKFLQEKAKFRVILGIQNFLPYSAGRNPISSILMEEFRKRLEPLEKKYNISLLSVPEDMQFHKTVPLPKPFKKNDKVKAKIVSYGRFFSDRLAAAKDRAILVPNCKAKVGEIVNIKITVDKHNIFYGRML